MLSGGLGHFWLLGDSSVGELDYDDSKSGFIRKVGDSVEVHTLEEDALRAMFGPDKPDIPEGIISLTEHTGAMLLDLSGRSSSANIGGSRASVARFKGRTLLAHPLMVEAASTNVESVSSYFRGNGLLAWADFDAIDRTFETDSQHKLKSAQINLKPTDERTLHLTRSSELRLSAHWEFADDDELQHVVRTSLEVILVSHRPVDFRSLLYPLLRCQELLCIAFGGFLRASGGRVGLEGLDERGHVWNSYLMPETEPARVPRAAVNERPRFHLNDIKGLDGVARWIRLSRKHPRAVSPIINTYRLGPGSDAARLLEVAAAIEYWVARHRRADGWARKGANHAEAVALHVGSAFSDWCGDSKKWAKAFWSHYNGLKHDPKFDPDPYAVKALQESGYLLLVADLLNRVGATKRPSRRLFADYRNDNLKDLLHDVLGS